VFPNELRGLRPEACFEVMHAKNGRRSIRTWVETLYIKTRTAATLGPFDGLPPQLGTKADIRELIGQFRR